MTRFGYVMTTSFAVLAVGVLSFLPVAPKLIWNASASVPLGTLLSSGAPLSASDTPTRVCTRALHR